MACSDNEDHHERLLQSFAEKGWCPRQVDYLRNTFNEKVLSYLSSLDRRFRNISHAICQDSTHCSAYNVDPETYEPAHTSDCSTTSDSCTLATIDTGRLMETIQKGKAPLISIEVKDDDDVSLKITSRTHETQYIAISHVWSDGLGNPKCNGLPSCQVKRLNQQIAKLKLLGGARPPPFIWIDTLCVPVEPKHSYYRKQEIKRMPSIYAAATAILVLDSELKHIDSRAINPAEILARIICSVWMQRCWTLQEGIVSRLCFFQFKDEPIDPPVFFFDTKDFPTAEQLYTYEILQSHLWERLHYGRSGGVRYSYNCKEAPQRQRWEWVQSQPRKDSKGTRAMYPRSPSAQRRSRCKILAHNDSTAPSYLALQLVRTWNELSHRSTSRIEDIYAIMASVLGFSPEKIMNLQNNAERLQVVLFSLPYLPVSLFFNTGPRHKQAEVHNNRWVPEDIGNCMLHEGGTMSFTNEGLHLNLRDRPDIYLVAGPSSHDITFHVSTRSEAIYEVKLFHEYSQGNDTFRVSHRPSLLNRARD